MTGIVKGGKFLVSAWTSNSVNKGAAAHDWIVSKFIEDALGEERGWLE